MKHASVKRSRTLGGGYGPEWATWITDDPDWMRGDLAFHPTHAEALAHALAAVGLGTHPAHREAP